MQIILMQLLIKCDDLIFYKKLYIFLKENYLKFTKIYFLILNNN